MREVFDRLEDTPEEHPLRETETVYHGKIFDLVKDRFGYGDENLVREYIRHPGAVAIVAVNGDGLIAVIDQYRHPMRKRMWEIPAGLLDVPGEAPLDAARRELAEETDLVAQEWTKLLTLDNSPGGSAETLHVYLATGVRPAGQRFDRQEEEADMAIGWASLDTILDAILASRVSNPSLLTGVLGYAAWLERHRP